MDSYTEQFYNLGLQSLEEGDEAAAMQYFERAADQGLAPAQFRLGLLYENGNSSSGKDLKKARQYYQKAAEQDYAPAQFNLGYLYCQTPGGMEQGMSLIRMAAENGDEAASEYLQAAIQVEEEQKRKEKETRRIRSKLKALIAKKELFVTVSAVTRHPYLTESADHSMKQVCLYTNEKNSREAASILSEKGYPASSLRLQQKIFLPFFSELYTLGVNALCVHDGRENYEAMLAELVKRKDMTGLPTEKRPVENPDLQYAMLRFMQEIRSKTETPDPAYRNKLDNEMVKSLLTARYLLPFKEPQADTLKGQEQKSGRQILVITNPAVGKKLVPVFTDMIEYTRFQGSFTGSGKLKLTTAGLEALAGMDLPGEMDGYLINPSTSAVPLPLDYIRRIARRIEQLRQEQQSTAK